MYHINVRLTFETAEVSRTDHRFGMGIPQVASWIVFLTSVGLTILKIAYFETGFSLILCKKLGNPLLKMQNCYK